MTSPDSMTRLAQLVQLRLASLESSQRRRSLRPLTGGPAVDLTHNDYLGLRSHSEFQARARLAASSWPVGSGASRLLGGEHAVYGAVEQDFARWKGAESALFFPSGYAANEALMSALKIGDVAIFSDSLNHASLIDGMRLARLAPHQKYIFPHNELVSLDKMLRESQAAIKIIVVESLYSMDGDFCAAHALMKLCDAHRALLVVDEAHALGVYGPEGQGWMPAHGIPHHHYISINPCGKAMAASGAFICGPLWLRDYLINTARSFIYTTGPSPWIAAALQESIRTIANASQLRSIFHARVLRVLSQLRELGFDCGQSQSHIIPVIMGEEQQTLAAEKFCQARGLMARAIRPPTVPESSCRLRLSLHAGLQDADETFIIDVFKELADAMPHILCHSNRH
jgi:8-amino-7-oxononanoate synthase